MPSARPSSVPALGLVLGSCVSLQLGAAGAAHLFDDVSPAGVSFLRLAVAAVVLGVLFRPRVRGWTAAQWRAAVVFGVTLAAMNGMFYEAIARIPLGVAVTIEFVGPLALSAVLTRRARDLVWVATAAAGVATLGLSSDDVGGRLDPWGVAFALGAGAFWAAYILASSRVARTVPGQGGLVVAAAVAAVALAPFGAADAVVVRDDASLLLLAVVTSLLASVVPYTLELAALRRLSPRPFGIMLSLEPAVAMLFGWLLLDQGVDALHVVAAGAVIAASLGSAVTAPEPPRPAGTAAPAP